LVLLFVLETQTFLPFPGLIILSPHASLSFDWVLITHLSLFSLFNLVGRMLVELHIVSFNWIGVIVGARLIYLWVWPMTVLTCPAYEVCAQGTCLSYATLFGATWFKIAAAAVFATLHGYVSTVLLMMAPSRVGLHIDDPESEMEMAGHLMSCVLTLGIVAGTACGYVLYYNYQVPECS
jgi:hypothetical protein